MSQSCWQRGLAHPGAVRKWRKAGKARMHHMRPNVVRLLCPHAQTWMSAMAAANIVGPCTARKLEADRMGVTRNTSADTAD